MIFFTALILGVFSSLHCIGMCGPIALALPAIRKNFFTTMLSVLSYNMGRVVSYTSLGFFAGLIGVGFYNSTSQKWISIVLGTVIIIWAFLPRTNPENWRWMRNNYFIHWVRKKIGYLFRKRSYGSIFSVGLLNGLIPCGMVYISLVGAIASGTPVKGAGYMFFYGIGTIPLMVILLFSWQLVSPAVKKRLVKLTPIFIGLVGLLLVLRGLELGIPIISPQVIPIDSNMTTCYSVGK